MCVPLSWSDRIVKSPTLLIMYNYDRDITSLLDMKLNADKNSITTTHMFFPNYLTKMETEADNSAHIHNA